MDFKLFYHPDCPYSKKVIDFIEENDINLDLLNVEDEENKNNLERLNGKVQFPALYVNNDTIILESDDIITYLNESYKEN